MSAIWPLDNQYILRSIRTSAPDVLLRTPVDQGPSKTRPRTKLASFPLSFSRTMTRAEFAQIRVFHDDVLAFGSKQFEVVSPETHADIVAKFREPPSASDIGGGKMLVDLSLEVLP